MLDLGKESERKEKDKKRKKGRGLKSKKCSAYFNLQMVN